MEAHRVERKLSAIFAADVEGYSRLMGRDEVGTLRTLTAYRVIIDRLIASHRGRIFNTAGDSVLADFASAVDAVRMRRRNSGGRSAKENADRPAGEQMRFRIGIHVGDIIVQGDNLFGDAVNIAARLEALAEPGGICVSGTVRDHDRHQAALGFRRSRRAAGEEYRSADQGIPDHGRDLADRYPECSRFFAPPSRQALHRSAALRQYERRCRSRNISLMAWSRRSSLRCRVIRWLFVIARNSSFTYKGQRRRREAGRARVGCPLCARRLGAKGWRTGSASPLSLIEAETGTHLWADRFDGDLADIFELQDESHREGRRVSIEPRRSQAAETPSRHAQAARRRPRPPGRLTTRGLWHLDKATSEDNVLAERFFSRPSISMPTWRTAIAG